MCGRAVAGEAVLRALVVLLTLPPGTTRTRLYGDTVSYFKSCTGSGAGGLRDKVLVQLVQCLESGDDLVREGACHALAIIRGSECSRQLKYLYQCDSGTRVRHAARDTLVALGYFADVNIYDCSSVRHSLTPNIGVF